MALEFFCGICRGAYSNADEFSATRCGHIFHRHCLLKRIHAETFECPACGSFVSAEVKKIFATWKDEIPENLADRAVNLRAQIEQNVAQESEIQHKLDDTKQQCAQLQKDLADERNNIKSLQLEIQRSTFLNNDLGKYLEYKRRELNGFKQQFEANGYTVSNKNDPWLAKNRLIEELKDQLSHTTAELQKEVRHSTTLLVENIKLQQELDVNDRGNVHCAQAAEACQSAQLQLNKCELNEFNTWRSGAIKKTPTGLLHKNVYSLFKYAKKLHSVGIRHVFYENDIVYAKRTRESPKIEISSEDQVNDLLKKFKAINNAHEAATFFVFSERKNRKRDTNGNDSVEQDFE